MHIYISSSWKNRVRVRALAVALRELGHVAYDFTDPASRGEPELPPERFPQQFDPEQHDYSEYLNQSPEYRRAVEGNRRWLIEKCDLCLLLLPCGADSHADWGIAVGAGKRSIVIGHPPKGERTPSHLWAEVIFNDEATALDYLTRTAHLSLYSKKPSVGPLNALAKEAHYIATAHGFTDASPTEDIALMHSELSEALEDIRAGLPLNELHHEEEQPLAKPCGVPSEMADVVIRVFHFCAKHGIDLDKAVNEKMTYNDSRPYKHGGKKL